MNKQKLWQKNQTKLHPLVEQYTVGQDHILDKELMTYDIQASQAHAKALEQAGILDKNELEQLCSGLTELEQKFKNDEIVIALADEDCHTVIEKYLTDKLGVVGKKIHTGRSRNDQVLVALRLYMKDMIKNTNAEVLKTAEMFLKKAKLYKNIPLPGYSHTQQAMLSSLGHYYASFVESLLDDHKTLTDIFDAIDKNPLGSAAGFGTSIPIDRHLTTAELGFKNIQINSLYCQNSRGKFESLFLEGLLQVMMTLSKFANDLILFTSQEFGFFTIEEQFTTGSSIMPQKKNLDAMEILRANISVMISHQNTIKHLVTHTTSGYHRDLQLIKKPLIESVDIIKKSLLIVQLFIQGTKPNQEKIKKTISKEIFTADIANDMVIQKKLSFRDAYCQAMDQLDSTNINMEQNIKTKISLGAPGNLNLEHYEHQIQKLK
ncbi:MAG: argininosuccinate lyase [bacterium]